MKRIAKILLNTCLLAGPYANAADDASLPLPAPPEVEQVRAGKLIPASSASVDLSALSPWRDETRLPAPAAIASVAPSAPKRAATLPMEAASAADTIREGLVSALKASLPSGGEGIRLSVPNLPVNLDLTGGPWEVRYDFKIPAKGIGTVLCNGTLLKDGKPVRRFAASIGMDRVSGGVQVNRLVRRGEAFRPEDLTLVEGSLSQLPTDAMSSIDQVAGTSARAEIRPGTWITGKMIERPELVKNRQIVTLSLVRGPMRITGKGIARQSGALGDVIRVENIESKTEIFGKIVGREVVEVVQ